MSGWIGWSNDPLEVNSVEKKKKIHCYTRTVLTVPAVATLHSFAISSLIPGLPIG